MINLSLYVGLNMLQPLIIKRVKFICTDSIRMGDHIWVLYSSYTKKINSSDRILAKLVLKLFKNLVLFIVKFKEKILTLEFKIKQI